ncbi:MAG TPA: VOC family protein [Iamia sp.]|jgi:catechol 2,3-dioxygenase-like lactoylglutathione lyase family enzyme|nr:VOC family protein [Iamia sp.]
MDVLTMRTIFRCRDLDVSRRFWEDALGLTVAREYGVAGEVTGVVLFAGGGFVELTTSPSTVAEGSGSAVVWLQVASVGSEEARLVAAGVPIDRPAERMPWGLVECWLSDPDGVRIVLVETPPDHPLRRRVE